nr:MAG TPA: hypothetical protein [Bacteriophage sp.]
MLIVLLFSAYILGTSSSLVLSAAVITPAVVLVAALIVTKLLTLPVVIKLKLYSLCIAAAVTSFINRSVVLPSPKRTP